MVRMGSAVRFRWEAPREKPQARWPAAFALGAGRGCLIVRFGVCHQHLISKPPLMALSAGRSGALERALPRLPGAAPSAEPAPPLALHGGLMLPRGRLSGAEPLVEGVRDPREHLG